MFLLPFDSLGVSRCCNCLKPRDSGFRDPEVYAWGFTGIFRGRQGRDSEAQTSLLRFENCVDSQVVASFTVGQVLESRLGEGA